MKRSQLIIDLCRYVAHKKMISKNSKSYMKLSFITPLEKCDSLVKDISSKPVSDVSVAKSILHNSENLLKILPHKNNTSYYSQLEACHLLIFNSINIIHHYTLSRAVYATQ